MMRRLLLLVVVLVLLGLWLPPAPVLAQTYTLDPPADIVLGPFTAAGPYASADVPVTATTTDVTIVSVDIGVKDISGNAGFLINVVAFTNELQAKGGDVGTYTDVTDVDLALVTDAALVGPASYNITDFSVQQTIVVGDLTKPPGVYSTTLTFTATFN